MSTTFSIDHGSAVQAESLPAEEDSRILLSRRPALAVPRRRPRGQQPLRKNPNTPFPGRHLAVHPAGTGDAQTAARCREALRWITTLPEGAIQVHAESGRVTLEGTVALANEREVAGDAVRQLEGVIDVDNRIEVR
jgi:hypothetical protein